MRLVKSLQKIWPMATDRSAKTSEPNSERNKLEIEPRIAGSLEVGRQLVNGQYPFGREFLRIPQDDLWRVETKSDGQLESLHKFDWLEDLAILRSAEAIRLARSWVFGWIAQNYTKGEVAWQPDIAGTRVMRLLQNEFMLMPMAATDVRNAFDAAISLHTKHLRSRFNEAEIGLPRVTALAGLCFTELSDPEGKASAIQTARRLGEVCGAFLQPTIGIASRNPEELFKIAALLQDCMNLLSRSGYLPNEPLVAAERNAASILRMLRHFNGSLARFHGGGNPPRGQLDRLLAQSDQRMPPAKSLAMGFARMAAGQSTVIVDAAAPATGWQSRHAHASTLAFEFVAGQCPIIVNRGPGTNFDHQSRLSARLTESHSTLEVDGSSSARFNTSVFQKTTHNRTFIVCPDDVRLEQLPSEEGCTLIVSHNGFAPLFGLTHLRRLDLNTDGTKLWAEDTIWARTEEDHKALASALSGTGRESLPITVFFHLHPDVAAVFGSTKRRVDLTLASGECWQFWFDGPAELKLEPSNYLDEASGQSLECNRITLNAQFARGSAQLRWAFERAGARQ